MIPSIGPLEIVVVLVIALMLLGPKKLPEVGRSVGKGMREFKASITGERGDDERIAFADEPRRERERVERSSSAA